MTGLAAKARRLVGLFLLGAVLFNYPILSLVNRDSLLFGIPVLYLYLFGVWAVLILLISRVTGSAKPGIIPDNMEGEEEPPAG